MTNDYAAQQAQAFAQVSTQAATLGYTAVRNINTTSARRYSLVKGTEVIYFPNVAALVVGVNALPSPVKAGLYVAPRAEQKTVKKGTKHEILFNLLLGGVTVADLAKALNWTEKSARAAFHDDVNRRKGFGVRQVGNLFYLVAPEGVAVQFV